MPVSADMLRRLGALGLTMDQVAGVVEIIDAEDDARRAAKRNGNRERQARYRANHNNNATSRVTFRDDALSGVTTCDSSPEEKRKVSPCTPSKEKTQPSPDLLSLPPEAQAPSNKSRGRTLPDDWKPTERHFAEAEKLGRDRDWVASQAERMRDWALANRNRAVAKKADWDRMFLNWLRQQHERNPAPQSRAPPSWAPVDTKAALERAMAAKGIRT